MERKPETVASELIHSLQQMLGTQEDADTAIAIYKLCNWVNSQLETVKQEALTLTEQELTAKGMPAIKTPIGSAGWTQPEVKQLDEAAWFAALAQNPTLMERQRAFDLAQAALQQAQAPYLKLPGSRFFIR